MTIDTVVGPADVLHRLALVVECVDSVDERRASTRVRIGREVSPLLLPAGYESSWPCLDLIPRGPGRAMILFDWRTPTKPVRIRIVDPARRYVARRFELPLWKLAEIVAAEAAPPMVPAGSRLLRPWLSPGSAYQAAPSTTAIRGRVASGGTAVRWARITAIVDASHHPQAVGWAHADERGEFLLVIADTGMLGAFPTELDIDLKVIAPDPQQAPPVSDDAYADLVVETLPRSANPPGPHDLDNGVLRGRAQPAGYVANTAAVPQLKIPVGRELALTTDIPFTA
jgi:hypothetical protein